MSREKSYTSRYAVLTAALAMGAAGHAAQAGNYLDVVATQTPLIYYEFNETGVVDPVPAAIDNISALLGPDLYVNDALPGGDIVFGVASMTPAGGFDGFDAGNTAYNFNTSGAGSVVTHLFAEDPLNTDTTHNPMTMAGSSISMWFNTSDPNLADPFASGVLWRGDEGSGHNLNLRVIDAGGNGIVTLNLEEGEFITVANGTDGSTDYSDGAWHHVVATWEYDMVADSGMLNVYVDGGTLAGGEQVSTAFDSTSYAPILQESDPVNNPGVFDDVMDFDFRNRVGKGRNNSHRFNGDIDEVAAWNRALTEQEIADQYAAAFEEGSGLPGDLDGDGFVGIDDLNLVLANWNQNVPPANPLADPSGDGFVGIDDLNEVLGNWNAGTPPTAGAAVPEPSTLALIGLAGLASLRRRA